MDSGHEDGATCTFISKNESVTVDNNDTIRTQEFSKMGCCQACAWKEEQLRIARATKSKTLFSSERLLQNMADGFLFSSSSDNVQGLVKTVIGPYTDRQIKYANLLSHAIQCKTVSYDDPVMNENSKKETLKLHCLLQGSFPTIYQKYPPEVVNSYSLLFKIPGQDDSRPPIMLCSHLDVVPAGNDDNTQAWDVDPFAGYIKDGIVWGRGAIDNKHNVISQLGAVEEIVSSGSLPKRTTYVAIGHDEEIQGYNGASFIARRLTAENIKFEFILDEGTMCVAGAIPGYQEPVALIGCVEKGYMTVEISVSGSGGHSSIPPINEDSPVKVISKAIIALESNPLPPYFQKGSAFRNTLEYIADKVGFPFNIIFSNFWLFGSFFKHVLVRASNGAAASIRTTTAVTKINGGHKVSALPTEVKAYINHRIHPSDTIESVLDHDRNVINDKRVKLKLMTGSLSPSPVSDHRNSKGFHIIERTVKSIFGFISAPSLCIGNTDTRWYWGLSDNIYRFSPVPLSLNETSMFHGFNERIGIDTLTCMVDFYKEILLKCDD